MSAVLKSPKSQFAPEPDRLHTINYTHQQVCHHIQTSVHQYHHNNSNALFSTTAFPALSPVLPTTDYDAIR
jgi:hypothetical protein